LYCHLWLHDQTPLVPDTVLPLVLSCRHAVFQRTNPVPEMYFVLVTLPPEAEPRFRQWCTLSPLLSFAAYHACLPISRQTNLPMISETTLTRQRLRIVSSQGSFRAFQICNSHHLERLAVEACAHCL
jgi:hypothetical protein